MNNEPGILLLLSSGIFEIFKLRLSLVLSEETSTGLDPLLLVDCKIQIPLKCIILIHNHFYQ